MPKQVNLRQNRSILSFDLKAQCLQREDVFGNIQYLNIKITNAKIRSAKMFVVHAKDMNVTENHPVRCG